MARIGIVKPRRRGQKPIRFKRGALTAQARAAGKTVSQFCKSPPTTLARRRCAFKRNVLVGRGRKR